MKILLSVFACAPHSGSETGAGWRWAEELARAGHDVVALTDESRRPLIEAHLARHPVERLEIVYFRPAPIRGLQLNSRTAQFIYTLWQYMVLPCARRLHQQHRFDLVIHLTYGVFRHPSFMGWLGIPFVFGPVGGGEDAPWRLKADYTPSEKIRALARVLLNQTARLNPVLRLALSRATLILARTDHTRRLLPGPCQKRTRLYQEIGIDLRHPETAATTTARSRGTPLQLLFAGRLLSLKGIHFALDALALATSRGHDVHLTIVGSGPMEAWLKRRQNRHPQLTGHVTWIPRMPQPELFELYAGMHGFLFPSLHDSGGNVVLEALSFGLPVICLDLGGPATLVTPQCAQIVGAAQASRADLIEQLARAIGRLESDDELRLRMSRAALSQAKAMTWESRPAGALKMLEECLRDTAARTPAC